MDIDYSDGQEVEGQILRLIRQASDRSSQHAIASEYYSQAWPIRYHLCPERANLLRPFDFSGMDVLELGAGMGAVSRLLAEKARSLYVVEGTQPRFEVLRERLAGLGNWDGEVRNFESFQTERRFDVVCLIGVLEYSELFLKRAEGSSHLWLLKHCRQFLKPGGVLVVAIENALGLKYWSGAAEDHRATLFDGIVGYPDSPTPRTFSKKELTELLNRAGFGQVDRYYPFPDYKVPTTVVSEPLFEKAPDLAAELATVEPYRDYLGYPLIKYFPDSLAADNLSRAGLLADFSNSFLFVGSESNSPIRERLLRAQIEREEFAWHYGQGRRDATATVFSVSSPGGVSISKRLQSSDETCKMYSVEGVGDLQWTSIPSEAAAKGVSLRLLFARHAYFQDWERFQSLWSDFLRWSLGRGPAVDAVFTNARWSPEGFSLFDQEWNLKGPMRPSWFVLRNVFNLVREQVVFTKGAPFPSFAVFYHQTCSALRVTPDLEGDLQREAAMQAAVTRGDKAHHYAQLKGLFHQALGPSVLPRVPAVESALRSPQPRWTLHRLSKAIRRRVLAIPRAGAFLRRVYRKVKNASAALQQSAFFFRPLVLRTISAGNEGEFTAGCTVFPKGWLLLKCIGTPGPLSIRFGFRVDGQFTQQEIRIPQNHLVLKTGVSIESLVLIGVRSLAEPRIRVRRISRFEAALRSLPWARWARLLRPAYLRAELNIPVVDAYGAWLQNQGALTSSDRKSIEAWVKKIDSPLVFSILLPVFNSPEAWLRRAIESVVNQIYPYWELCIADDASTSDVVRVLEEYSRKDSRIKVVRRTQNGHISEASNSALGLATGTFCVLLDHDDELASHALAVVAQEITLKPDLDLIYSDEDKIDIFGRRFDPHFKAGWNPELLTAQNYISHLGVYRTSLLRKIGGFRKGFEGSQDYDLVLRFSEQTSPERIRHVPEVLYHWRAIPGSVALSENQKSYAHERARNAIREYYSRRGESVHVEPGYGFTHRVRFQLPSPAPLVSVLIPTRDRKDLLQGVVRGLRETTQYPNWELIILDNQSTDPSTLAYFRELKSDPRIRILRHEAEFNFSALINLGARAAQGQFLALLNNDLEMVSSEWLDEMVSLAARRGVGCVGAKLLYPDGRIQHAGVTLGIGGVADHRYRFAPGDSNVSHCRLQVPSVVSAVTAACLVVRKAIFFEVGGFNEKDLAIAYNDVDFGLRVREAGYRNLWTPHAVLVHLESANRGSDESGVNRLRLERESKWMRTRWEGVLERDPYYSSLLTLRDPNGGLAAQPRYTPFYRKQPTTGTTSPSYSSFDKKAARPTAWT